MAKKIKSIRKLLDQPTIDEFHMHEAMHTTMLVSGLFDENVLESRCAEFNPDVKKLATRISDDLGRLYQLIGKRRFQLWPGSAPAKPKRNKP